MTSTETTSTSYPPRNETEKFIDFMDFLLKEDTLRSSIILAGISACETMKKYEKNVFYEYDLTRCASEKYDETCHGDFLNKAVRNAYKKYGSPTKNIAVFRHLESLKECNDITKLNGLWSLADGKKFNDPVINVILLYEENFPRDGFSEKFGILSYLGIQRKRCKKKFEDNDFNSHAFASRMREYHVEQEPQNQGECKLELDLTENPKPPQFWTPTTNFFLFVMIFVVVALVVRENQKKKSKK